MPVGRTCGSQWAGSEAAARAAQRQNAALVPHGLTPMWASWSSVRICVRERKRGEQLGGLCQRRQRRQPGAPPAAAAAAAAHLDDVGAALGRAGCWPSWALRVQQPIGLHPGRRQGHEGKQNQRADHCGRQECLPGAQTGLVERRSLLAVVAQRHGCRVGCPLVSSLPANGGGSRVTMRRRPDASMAVCGQITLQSIAWQPHLAKAWSYAGGKAN